MGSDEDRSANLAARSHLASCSRSCGPRRARRAGPIGVDHEHLQARLAGALDLGPPWLRSLHGLYASSGGLSATAVLDLARMCLEPALADRTDRCNPRSGGKSMVAAITEASEPTNWSWPALAQGFPPRRLLPLPVEPKKRTQPLRWRGISCCRQHIG